MGALAMGVLPAASVTAAAEGPSPAVSYLDVASQPGNTRWLRSAAPDGSAAVALTPAGYYTYTYDVAADGDTLVLGVRTSPSAPSWFDHTYGLVLVKRTSGTVISRVLANSWDTSPCLSPDASSVWWMADGRVWRYAASSTTRLTGALFEPRSGEYVADFAVSPDGSKGAVVYGSTTETSHLRVLAASFAAGRAQPYFELERDADPTYTNLVWMDNASLLYGYSPAGSSTLRTGAGALVPGGNGETETPGDLTDLYDIRKLGSDWWLWRDTGAVTEFARVTDLADAASAAFTPRSNGSSTLFYLPSAVVPPPLTSAVNRASTHPWLYLSAGTAKFGARLVYSTGATYLHALPGQSFSRDAFEVDRGILQTSPNGRTWVNSHWTSWAHPVPWPGDPGYYGNAYTPRLTRNTWFRWVFPGDYLTKASTSPVRKVVVTPIIKAKVVKKRGKRVVSGTVTRVGGKIYLYKGSRKLATATIRANGAYKFKARSLSKGTYTLKVRADASWGAASKKLRI